MKRGYKRLLIFELVIFAFLILNSFVSNILSSYKTSIFMLFILVVFKVLFGFEKDKQRYTKDIVLDVIIFLISFFILYYLFGLIIGFYKTDNYFTMKGIFEFIIPTIIYLGVREFLRYMFMLKADGNRLLTILTIILFLLLDITTAVYVNDFTSKYNTFIFLALTFLPALSLNGVFCYFTKKVGYKPLMFYALVMGIYSYIVPIAPNPGQYVTSVMNFILPLVLGFMFHRFLKQTVLNRLDRDYRKKRYVPLILSSVVVTVLVYFVSGYFHYWAIAVGSASMNPTIKKGDVAIIEKIDGHFDTLKEGQVIAFKYNDIIIVHRLIRIIKYDNKYYFYTKGDMNPEPDNFVIEEKMIIGIVNHKIPVIGKPTVWLNELLY